MPENFAPGVFVEETSFRSKSIKGVSTSTTAFVGVAQRGPVGEIPELLTSFAEFERVYGGAEDVGGNTNYLAHSVMAYFKEGGARLYVARAYPISGTLAAPNPLGASPTQGNPKLATAIVRIPGAGGRGGRRYGAGGGGVGSPTNVGYFQARFPGAALNGKITVTVRAALSSVNAWKKAVDGSLFRVTTTGRTPTTSYFTKTGAGLTIKSGTGSFPTSDSGKKIEVLTLSIQCEDSNGNALATYDGLGFHPDHQLYIGKVLALDQNRRADHLAKPYAFVLKSGSTAFQVLEAFEAVTSYTLAGGEDPTTSKANFEAALSILEGIDDVSIVAAPGYTAIDTAIANSLITHAEKRTYRIAVLETPKGVSPTEARDYRAKLDSKYAALYYPWVIARNPLFDPNDTNTNAELTLPPSGFVCGIYARNDIERGVWKAPANVVVRTALRFERSITTGEQELLNPLGVNCLRYFAGRGKVVWGARTASSDPEWKYVNVRRYFNYLEHSIDRGTQWAVFEPNGERLWANFCDTVSSFLYNQWVNGALLGDKPEQAYFVKCDRSTMTQNDLDNGQLIALVGVAALKPVEFVIFRIGQKTADART